MTLDTLRLQIRKRMSEKRYRHTLSVERTAVAIAGALIPDKLPQMRAAALLHDIAKEMNEGEQIEIMRSLTPSPTDSDFMTPPMFHSLVAPIVIRREFSEFATSDVLSAVKNHTVGAPDMSLFDEIIFTSDFIEEERKYPVCQKMREEFFREFNLATSPDEKEQRLHETTVKILDYTITYIINNRMYLNERTVMARNAFLGRLPVPLKTQY